MKKREPGSGASPWRRRSLEILTASEVARGDRGPEPPAAWESTLKELLRTAHAPVPGPGWWTPRHAYFGSIETRTDPARYHWDGMKRLRRRDDPLVFFQFTLAGWGIFQRGSEPARRVPPGTGFFAVVPSRHRYYLPPDSPGWTFGWLGIYHPYLRARIATQVAATGPVVEAEPSSALITIAARLVRGAFKKDFPDRFAVELALFEFVIALERHARLSTDPTGERERILEAVRARVIAQPNRAPDVAELAESQGMTRSNFSHRFRVRTGVTPARFLTEIRIQEASRMLVETTAPLKVVASHWGFANQNHFCKVFRRIQRMSPGSYRRSIR